MNFRKTLFYGIVGASLVGTSVSEARIVGSSDSLDSRISKDSFVYVPKVNLSVPLSDLDSSRVVEISKPPVFVEEYELKSGDATYDEIRFREGNEGVKYSILRTDDSVPRPNWMVRSGLGLAVLAGGLGLSWICFRKDDSEGS